MNKLADIIIKDALEILEKTDISEIKGKTIMITGASGLIGGYFLACLKLASHTLSEPFRLVAVMHRKPPSYLTDFLDYASANIRFGDLSDYEFCKTLPTADYIIHAAGYGQPGRFMEDRVKTLRLNTLATFILLEKLNPDGKFLFISSCEWNKLQYESYVKEV